MTTTPIENKIYTISQEGLAVCAERSEHPNLLGYLLPRVSTRGWMVDE